MIDEIHVLNKGQVHIINVAQCGACKTEIRFPKWTNRIRVDSDIIKIYGWTNTKELGLLCPDCYKKLNEQVTKIDYQGMEA